MAKTYDPDHEKRVSEWYAKQHSKANADEGPQGLTPNRDARYFVEKMLILYEVRGLSRCPHSRC
jgi:hypothetical protein